MSSLAKKSFRILLGRGAVSVFSILFTVFFAYELPKSIFALIALYETAVSLSKVVTDLGLHYRIVREAPTLYYSGERERAINEIVAPSTLIRILSAFGVGALFFVVTIIFKNDLEVTFPEMSIWFIIIMATAHLIITNLESISSSVFAVEQKFGTDAFLESMAGFLESFLAVIFYLLFGINHYFTGILIGISLMVLLRIYVLRELLPYFKWKQIHFTKTRKILKEYFPFYLRKFVRIGFVQAEHLLIPAMLPLDQLANFKVAKKYSTFVKNYNQAFTDPLTIKLSKSKNIEHRQEFIRTFLWFTIPVPIILTLLSPWIMKIMGGPKYADSWFILAVFYFSYVFHALGGLQMIVISVFGKPTESLLRDTIGGLVGIISTFALILLFKENGIAWGQLISFFILYIVGKGIASKYIKQEAPHSTPSSL